MERGGQRQRTDAVLAAENSLIFRGNTGLTKVAPRRFERKDEVYEDCICLPGSVHEATRAVCLALGSFLYFQF